MDSLTDLDPADPATAQQSTTTTAARETRVTFDDENNAVTLLSTGAAFGLAGLPTLVVSRLALRQLGAVLARAKDAGETYAELRDGRVRTKAAAKPDPRRLAIAYALADDRLEAWKAEQKTAGVKIMPQDAARMLATFRDNAVVDVTGYDAAALRVAMKRWQVVRHLELLGAGDVA